MVDKTESIRPDTGGWTPPEVIDIPPVFAWPPRPLALVKWLFGFPGYFFPWNALYVASAVLTFYFLIPELEDMKTLRVEWIARLFAVNLVMIVAITSAWHLRLYVQQVQGIQFKYNKRWPKESSTFLFGNQLLDNIFWTVFSAVPIWTAYMVATLWAMANGWLPHLDWREHPVLFTLLLLSIPAWHEVHFYCIHRLIHTRLLYRWVHSIHHKNANPGPWSGLAMHPVEHLLYYSCVLVHWIVPSHPLHVVFHLQYLSFGPAQDHCGFGKVVVNGKLKVDAATYGHYLHHRYFEVNYGGESIVPLDRWFGTWHDGSIDAHETMNRRLRTRQQGTLTSQEGAPEA